MPKLKLNLKDVKPGMDPVPAGRYPIEVVDADIRFGKDSSNPYLWLHLKVVDGEFQKRRLFFQGTLDQESEGLGITFSSINALLMADVTGAEYELDTDELVGLEAVAVVGIEKDDMGAERSRVKYLRALEGEAAELAQTRRAEAADSPW